MNRLTRAKSWAVTAFLLVVSSAVVTLGLGLATGQLRAVPVLSGSMEPTLAAGDVAVLTPVDADSVAAGDVIVFHAPDGKRDLVIHRVLEVGSADGRPTVKTKGDANPTPDPWEAKIQGDVVWKLRGSVPLVGRVALWANSPMIRFGALVAAIGIVMLVALKAIWGDDPATAEVNAA